MLICPMLLCCQIKDQEPRVIGDSLKIISFNTIKAVHKQNDPTVNKSMFLSVVTRYKNQRYLIIIFFTLFIISFLCSISIYNSEQYKNLGFKILFIFSIINCFIWLWQIYLVPSKYDIAEYKRSIIIVYLYCVVVSCLIFLDLQCYYFYQIINLKDSKDSKDSKEFYIAKDKTSVTIFIISFILLSCFMLILVYHAKIIAYFLHLGVLVLISISLIVFMIKLYTRDKLACDKLKNPD